MQETSAMQTIQTKIYKIFRGKINWFVIKLQLKQIHLMLLRETTNFQLVSIKNNCLVYHICMNDPRCCPWLTDPVLDCDS